MPDWLGIVLAIAGPLGAFAGVFFSRGRTEQKVVGRIDLLEAKIDNFKVTIDARLVSLEKSREDAKESRIELRKDARDQERKLDSLRTVCKLTHPMRAMPDTVGD